MKMFDLYDVDSVELFECMENAKLDLKKNNDEYKDISRKIEKIKEKYPNIRGILEDEKVTQMSALECSELVNCINLYRDLLRIEQNEIFFLGGRWCFEYLRRIGVV